MNKNKNASVKSTETTKAKAKEVVAKHEARKALKADRVEVRHGEVGLGEARRGAITSESAVWNCRLPKTIYVEGKKLELVAAGAAGKKRTPHGRPDRETPASKRPGISFLHGTGGHQPAKRTVAQPKL